jgi:ParB family transcriptional regulator, chromosome partitioning protein
MDQAGDRPFASRQRMPTGAESPLMHRNHRLPPPLPYRRSEFLRTLLLRSARLDCVKPFFPNRKEETKMPATTTTTEFQNIPLNLIIVEKQIRTGADVDDEASQGLKDSIAAKGVLEPILVTPLGEKYRLLAGERRYRACQQLGLETIPARILPDVQPGEEVLTIQLIENLQRQEIDPIDKANGILEFFQSRHEGMELEAVFSTLVTCDRDPARVENEFAETVSAISKYVGMTTRTIENLLSLLTLPQEICDAVKTGAVPVSQGYILAANVENPGLMAVFESILANPVTNKRLTELLKKAGQTDPPAPTEPTSPFRPVYVAAQKLANCLENGEFRYDLAELENLRLFFLSVIEVIERAKAGGGTAKEPELPPEKKVY